MLLLPGYPEERLPPTYLPSKGLVDRTAFKFTKALSEPAVGAGLGRCAGGRVHAEPQPVSEVSWYTAIPTPALLGTSRDLEPENSGEYLSAKTMDANHEEVVYSGGKSPRGLAFTLGFSTPHGNLYSL